MSERFSQLDVDRINMRQRAKKQPDSGVNVCDEFEGRESELHRLILEACQVRRFYVVHSRCDRATTQQKGVPDMILALPDGKTIWLEIKVGKNKLSADQNITKHVLGALGHSFYCVRTLFEFLQVLNEMDRIK